VGCRARRAAPAPRVCRIQVGRPGVALFGSARQAGHDVDAQPAFSTKAPSPGRPNRWQAPDVRSAFRAQFHAPRNDSARRGPKPGQPRCTQEEGGALANANPAGTPPTEPYPAPVVTTEAPASGASGRSSRRGAMSCDQPPAARPWTRRCSSAPLSPLFTSSIGVTGARSSQVHALSVIEVDAHGAALRLRS
jgi:hypothetical protein